MKINEFALLYIDIVDFGDTFIGKYQVLHPQTGFSAVNFNAVEPTFQVVRVIFRVTNIFFIFSIE